MDGAVCRHREGLAVQLLKAGADDVERVLEDGLEGLTLDAGHRILGAPARGRGHGAARTRHLDLTRARPRRDDLDAARRPNRLLDRPHVHAEPPGK